MHLSNTFTIYNASAGSGKTFNLVKEYLILLLTSKNDDAYKNILAVTFTNKAVNEMKNRIVDKLIEFSDKETIDNNSAIIKELIKETKLSIDQINIKSNKILKHLLKNYAAFEISTIDRFTQRIVRSFSYELNIDAKYEVEIDEEELLNKAVDQLISKTGENKELTKIYIDYAFDKADDNKNWDISLNFRKIAKFLVNENSYEIVKTLQKNTVSEFLELKKYLTIRKKASIDNSITISKKVFDLINSKGIDQKSFMRKTLPKHFSKIINKNYVGLYNNQLEDNLINGYLYAKTIDENQKQLIDSICKDLLKTYRKVKDLIYEIKLYNNLLNNITPLSILNAINNELSNIKAENNTILISEFSKIINEEIKNQPAPFIYEKIGCKYKNYFIDEFQDTSNLQWGNLIPLLENSLSSENSSLTISGDAKQSIYGWRGSQVEQFIKLVHKENPFNIDKTIINLPINYRSSKNIIQFNNKFFSHIGFFVFRNDYFKQIYTQSSQEIHEKSEGYVNITLIKQNNDQKKEEVYNTKILDIITTSLKNGHQLKDICIITRKRKEGAVIAGFLSEKGIDLISSESLLINSSLDVKFIMGTINYCLSESSTSKLEILNYIYEKKKVNGLKDEFITEFIHLDLVNFYKKLEKHNIFFDKNALSRLSIYESIEYIIYSFNITEESNSYLQFFLDFTLEYSNKFHSSLYDFINYYEEKKEKLSIASPSEINAVEIMTIHKSKGLEFPIVIYPFADLDIYKEIEPKEWLPIKDENISNFSHLLMNFNKDVENYKYNGKSIFNEHISKLEIDNINLLYVTLTRAQKELYIIGSQCFDGNGKENLNLYSGLLINFLKETKKWDNNKDSYHFGSPTQAIEFSKSQNNILKAKEFICNPKAVHGISLASKSILLWESSKKEAIEKGNLIHDIMSHINSYLDIDKTMNYFLENGIINKVQYNEISSIILLIVNHPKLKEYYDSNLLSYNEREIIQKNNNNLRPDRIVFNKKNEVIIIDYKTGTKNIFHEKQLNKYDQAIRKMGYKVVKKLLIYIENDSIIVENY